MSDTTTAASQAHCAGSRRRTRLIQIQYCLSPLDTQHHCQPITHMKTVENEYDTKPNKHIFVSKLYTLKSDKQQYKELSHANCFSGNTLTSAA